MKIEINKSSNRFSNYLIAYSEPELARGEFMILIANFNRTLGNKPSSININKNCFGKFHLMNYFVEYSETVLLVECCVSVKC